MYHLLQPIIPRLKGADKQRFYSNRVQKYNIFRFLPPFCILILLIIGVSEHKISKSVKRKCTFCTFTAIIAGSNEGKTPTQKGC